MAKGIVYKQWYKSKSLSSTPILNRKHLAYIATRPGAVHNPGCGFGLWGRLPDTQTPEDIDDLRLAKRVVTEASRDHTIWRAVISVDKDTAKQHDLYSRKTWEPLVNKKIGILAKEMGIKESDFCWMASMHYEKGHPHVHIMYWDRGDAIHQEFIPKERFELMAERVRAEFGREVYHEEIHDRQVEQSNEAKALRLELRAMLKEANLAEALDLSHVKAPVRDRLTASLAELAATAPTRGSLDYAYLDKFPKYKEKLDAFIGEVLKISDLQKALKQYEKVTAEISAMYGNGEEKAAFEMERARKKLYKSLGNEIMDTIRQYRKELTLEAPTDREDLRLVLQTTADALMRDEPLYQDLLDRMPKERTPMGELLKDEAFRETLHKLAGRICADARVNARIRGYVTAASEGMTKDEAKELRRGVFQEAHRDVTRLIMDGLQEDAGYPRQFRDDIVTILLIRLLGEVSRSGGQQQARRDLLRPRQRELSKTARRDRAVQQEQEGSWKGLE